MPSQGGYNLSVAMLNRDCAGKGVQVGCLCSSHDRAGTVEVGRTAGVHGGGASRLADGQMWGL